MFAPRGWVRSSGTKRIYRVLKESSMFDAAWYRRHQAHGVAKIADPVWHYMDEGAPRGLDPSVHFDTRYYRSQYPDVRDSGLNPLFHYLEYGIPERRSPMRSPWQTLTHYSPDTTALAVFLTPREDRQRVSLIIDAATSESPMRAEEILLSAHRIALSQSGQMRVISRPSSMIDVPGAIQAAGLEGLDIQVTTVSPLDDTDSVPMYGDETMLATSWSSAAALRFTGGGAFLLEPSGTSPLGPHSWRDLAIGQLERERNENSSPAPTGASKRSAENHQGLRIGVVADAKSSPLSYALCLIELEQWIFRSPHAPEQISIDVYGQGLERVRLAGEYEAALHETYPGDGRVAPELVLLCGRGPGQTETFPSERPGVVSVTDILVQAGSQAAEQLASLLDLATTWGGHAQ